MAEGLSRRDFIRRAAVGTAVVAVGGGVYHLLDDRANAAAAAEKRADGRARLPPGQRLIGKLKPMGGDPGASDVRAFALRVSGAVKAPYTLDYAALLGLPQTEQQADVHCVTGWSLLGATWKGVTLALLAEKAGVKPQATDVIFEAAHGYTANVPLREALANNVMVTYRHNGKPLAPTHGAPVRALVPDLYFWKSAKWLTGVRFVTSDEPGYWETRGYHNHADPWREERYAEG